MGGYLSQLGAGPTSGRPRLTGGKIDLFTFWHNRTPSDVAMRNTGAQPCPRPWVPDRFPPRIRPRLSSPRPLRERDMVRGHSPSFGMATPVGSISEASSSAVTIPSPLAGEGQGEGVGNVIAWRMPPHASMAWLRHAGHEGAALDGVSPPLRGWASDFGKTRSLWQITPKVFSPTCSPYYVGFPRFTRLSHGTSRWALTFPSAEVNSLTPGSKKHILFH